MVKAIVLAMAKATKSNVCLSMITDHADLMATEIGRSSDKHPNVE